MIRHFITLILALTYALPSIALQDTMPQVQVNTQQVAEGEKIFTTFCKACHQLERRLVGPPLQDIRARRDDDWIISFVKSATSVIQSGDSVANALFEEYNRVLMPDQPLDENQIMSVLSYLDHSATAKVAVQPISRPVDPLSQGPDPFRFDDFGFWITYTVCVILLIVTIYLLVENFSMAHPDQVE